MSINPIKPLNNQELRAKAPSLFQNQPYSEVSDKYHFIPTINIVEQLREQSWFPVAVSQSNVRDETSFVLLIVLLY